MSKSLSDVMDKLGLFERSQNNFLHVVYTNCKSFKMIWSLIIIYQNYKVTEYLDHDESCYSTEHYKGIRLRSSNLKYHNFAVLIIDSFITPRNMGVVSSVHAIR